jgi:hypothetical protein
VACPTFGKDNYCSYGNAFLPDMRDSKRRLGERRIAYGYINSVKFIKQATFLLNKLKLSKCPKAAAVLLAIKHTYFLF